METIIKVAIEGGYEHRMGNIPIEKALSLLIKYHKEELILNPLFWQALGKACGWPEKVSIDYGNWDEPSNISYEERVGWQVYALRFHEINLTEGWEKAVEYLESLITK